MMILTVIKMPHHHFSRPPDVTRGFEGLESVVDALCLAQQQGQQIGKARGEQVILAVLGGADAALAHGAGAGWPLCAERRTGRAGPGDR